MDLPSTVNNSIALCVSKTSAEPSWRPYQRSVHGKSGSTLQNGQCGLRSKQPLFTWLLERHEGAGAQCGIEINCIEG